MREIPEEELEYFAREKTQSEIAEIYGCTQGTIHNKMKKYDIRRCRKTDTLDEFLSSIYDPIIDMSIEEED